MKLTGTGGLLYTAFTAARTERGTGVDRTMLPLPAMPAHAGEKAACWSRGRIWGFLSTVATPLCAARLSTANCIAVLGSVGLGGPRHSALARVNGLEEDRVRSPCRRFCPPCLISAFPGSCGSHCHGVYMVSCAGSLRPRQMHMSRSVTAITAAAAVPARHWTSDRG